ncbi:hypothetical protein LCGC14_2234630 [marine sediment metagenome]|uniref:Phage protein Gp37/Gp68 n=1 Tax=marine sediment metagenome TaxID=412755 RepID=A0A0F9DUS6_9ZZZZ
MSDIEWTDKTWNPVVGCKECSPGCRECYAARIAHRGMSPQHKGLTKLHVLTDGSRRVSWNGQVGYVRSLLTKPIGWRRARKVFVGSMTDLFYKEVRTEWLDEIFAVILIALLHTRQIPHVFQLLTKRARRMAEYTNDPGLPERLARCAGNLMEDGDAWYDRVWQHVRDHGPTHEGLWLGTTVEDDPWMSRVEYLMRCPATVRFLSCEPLLGPINALRLDDIAYRDADGRLIDWVIAGGESGPKARPCDIDWIRRIVTECGLMGVPVFVKQLGKFPIEVGDRVVARELGLRNSKGGDPSEWPEDLRVREWPGTSAAERVA